MTTNANSPLLDDSPSTLNVQIDIGDEKRLSFIDNLEIVDEPQERSMQVVVQLATKLLNAPVSLITMVLEDRQFFVASEGLTEKWAQRRQTPLSHSFCRHVVEGNDALAVSNAANHPLVLDNQAIPDLGVSAYLGVPLRFSSDSPVGALCVIDSQPRRWTEDDLQILKKLSALTCSELAVRKQAHREQKRLESQLRQAQKSEAIGQCVVGISHDINNILGAIQTAAEVLDAKLSQQKIVAEEVGQIKETVNSAKKLMTRLLRWGRPGQRMKTMSLTQIVRDALPVVRACVSSTIEIAYSATDSDAQTLIVADEGEISQLLLNLCTNAEHAMREHGGTINIEVKRTTSPDMIELTVTDTGTGISAEYLHRIQDPYFTTKPMDEGNGLGLWTVFGIATGHDAEINVDSTVGTGTCVEVKFPVAKVVGPAEPEEKSKTAPLTPKRADELRNILLVDDNEVILEGMCWLLSLHDFNVVSCTDSVTAFQRFLKAPQNFDLVISDRRMPKMSGEELLAAVKAIRKETATILSSGVAPSISERLPVGVDAFCLKPWTIDELKAVIAKACKT